MSIADDLKNLNNALLAGITFAPNSVTPATTGHREIMDRYRELGDLLQDVDHGDVIGRYSTELERPTSRAALIADAHHRLNVLKLTLDANRFAESLTSPQRSALRTALASVEADL